MKIYTSWSGKDFHLFEFRKNMLVVVTADFRIKDKILADRRIILSVPYPAKPGFRVKIEADNSRRFAIRHTRYRA